MGGRSSSIGRRSGANRLAAILACAAARATAARRRVIDMSTSIMIQRRSSRCRRRGRGGGGSARDDATVKGIGLISSQWAARQPQVAANRHRTPASARSSETAAFSRRALGGPVRAHPFLLHDVVQIARRRRRQAALQAPLHVALRL